VRSSLLPAVLLCGLITLVGCGGAGERTAGRPGGSSAPVSEPAPVSVSGGPASDISASDISAGDVEELERTVSAADDAAGQAERDARTP
jgi:hypothetical protein